MSAISVRPLSLTDAPAVLALMRRAEGGLGRLPEEMDLRWMEDALTGALDGGIAIGVWDGPQLAGIIKASRMPSVQFQHVLWDLTIAVAPEAQGKGVGRRLFSELLASAAALTPKVERVELVVREGLTHAIRLYERVGFRQEGRFEGRFRLADGTCEADIPMALFIGGTWARRIETRRTGAPVSPRRRPHCAVMPPSILNSVPVTNLLSSEAR